MFFELIGTVLAGLSAALLVFALRYWKPDLVAKWAIPVAAGGAMILAAISSEYGWYDRTRAAMPEGLVVAHAIEQRSPFRPWTYVAPYVDRFVAVDRAGLRTNEAVPDQRIVDLYFFGRWSPVHVIPVLFDCAGNRSATLVQGVEFGPDGQVAGADWSGMAADDPVLRTACAEA